MPGAEKEAAVPLRRDELSLYSVPPQRKLRAEPEAGRLEESVASLRKFAEPYTDRCQVNYSKVKPRVQRVVRWGSDTYAYLRNPPEDFYPRAGIIVFTGVLGLFLARGSRVKRLVYPAGLVTVSASLYYPEQAVTLAKSTGDSVYGCAVQTYGALESLWNPSRGADSQKPTPGD